jgi:CRISPR-associated endoribonuclease Cas6
MALEKKVVQHLPKRATFYKMDFRVDDVFTHKAEHAWAGQSSFPDMAQDGANCKSAHDVRMEFVSPTAFRNNGLDICVPVSGQVFRSLWARWNAFCPEPMQIQEEWPDFAAGCILVNELTAVNTTHWVFAEGNRGSATGFTGIVGFYLPEKGNLADRWRPYYDGAVTVMQSLANFAFYCGVGHHTTIGMGQSRLLINGKSGK